MSRNEREKDGQTDRERWIDRKREREGGDNLENVLLKEISECRKAFIYNSNWTE